MNINSLQKLSLTKMYEIDHTNNSCYEVSISTFILPFALQYNKKLKKGCCSNCGYSILVNTTNISSPIGNINASIFGKSESKTTQKNNYVIR
jgi:hypothetical protein